MAILLESLLVGHRVGVLLAVVLQLAGECTKEIATGLSHASGTISLLLPLSAIQL